MERLDAFFYVFYASIVDGRYHIVSDERLKRAEEARIEGEYAALRRSQSEYTSLLSDASTAYEKDATRGSKKGAKTEENSHTTPSKDR